MRVTTRPAPAAAQRGLQVEGLGAGYGKRRVIKDVSFSVAPGEILTILGRNGAGKSTALLAIAGFLGDTDGRILIDGREARGPAYERSRRSLSIVINGRSLFPSLTVRENLQLANVKLTDVVRLFPELERRATVRAGLLSGGEQQMLAVARAVLRGPHLLLLDELTFGLSPGVSLRLLDALLEISAVGDTAIVVVEQHIHLAQRVATKALIMGEGRIRLRLDGHELAARGEEIEHVYLGRPSDDDVVTHDP